MFVHDIVWTNIACVCFRFSVVGERVFGWGPVQEKLFVVFNKADGSVERLAKILIQRCRSAAAWFCKYLWIQDWCTVYTAVVAAVSLQHAREAARLRNL